MITLEESLLSRTYITRDEPGRYHADNGLSIRRRYPVTSDGTVTWAVYATCDTGRKTIKLFRTLAEAKAWVSA